MNHAYKDLLLTISTSVSQYAILDPVLDCLSWIDMKKASSVRLLKLYNCLNFGSRIYVDCKCLQGCNISDSLACKNMKTVVSLLDEDVYLRMKVALQILWKFTRSYVSHEFHMNFT